MKRTAAIVAVIGLALVGASCGSDSDSSDGSSSDGGSSAAVAVDGAWARTSPSGVENGAAYMVLTSESDNALVGASASGDIAETIELHETIMTDDAGDSDMGEMDSGDTDTTETTAMDSMDADDMTDDSMTDDSMDDHSDMDMGGAMSMQEVSSIPLPAGEAVALEPGGYHVMLLGLTEPLEMGQTFTLTLDFEDGSHQDVEVEVRDDAP